MNVQNIQLPGSGEVVKPDPEKIKSLRESVVVIKYGGNAMVDESAGDSVFDQIAELQKAGIDPVIVHGGGPFIKRLLDSAGIVSEFVDGHRKTDAEAMKYVEMALSGFVNGRIVKELNARGVKAVGLSGKDAGMVKAEKRMVEIKSGSETVLADLGYVGNVVSVDTDLVLNLLDNGYIPVVAPIGTGPDYDDYNINADMFAGNLAGALQASAFVALTDVDGLMEDLNDPGSRIESLSMEDVRTRIGSTIVGGMIPKMESCLIALEKGVKNAHIINGMVPDTLLLKLLTSRPCGTTIKS